MIAHLSANGLDEFDALHLEVKNQAWRFRLNVSERCWGDVRRSPWLLDIPSSDERRSVLRRWGWIIWRWPPAPPSRVECRLSELLLELLVGGPS